jgi:hypothetical protein
MQVRQTVLQVLPPVGARLHASQALAIDLALEHRVGAQAAHQPMAHVLGAN